MAEPSEHVCPDCGEALSPIAGTGNLLQCARCRRQFFAPAPGDKANPTTETELPPTSRDELDAVRIRARATARRAAYRARSYCIIAAGVCAAAVVQLALMIFRNARAGGRGLMCAGYALFALLAAWGLVYFLIRARAFHREARKSDLTEPASPPDFSTLENGSKRAKNLENVR